MDVAQTLALLWRESTPARRGPKPRYSVDDVVETAIALADSDGLDAVTIRAVAERLNVSPMSLYTYVPGKAELLDLMLDALYLAMPRAPHPEHWRDRLRAVADANRELYERHRWAARVSTARPPLGPGLMAKYEHELGALDGLGLTDVEMDAALTFLLGFVQANAVAAQDHASAPGTDAEWWETAGPLLARVVDPERYPLAARVGSAAGAAQGGAYDAERAYAFGLERVLDGLAALIDA
ncbi:MAG TPA: TetR/AcrR family transcriptional regulator [Solirubrobacter sp.]|nr:TetR/AcrR family transcriptional regulator [Solirubrobacter sp.]